MNVLKYYTSDKYIAAPDLDGKDVQVTIKEAKVEVVKGAASDPGKKRVILYFTKGVKGLVLNKTNVKTLVAKYGNSDTDWTGKTITLHPTTCAAFGNNNTPCIRIK